MLVTCPACGAANQEVGKFCEQCGAKVPGLVAADPIATNGNGAADASLSIDQLTPPDSLAENGGASVYAPPDAPAAPADVHDDTGDGGTSVNDGGGMPVAPSATADPMPAIPPAPAGEGTTGKVRFVRLENGVQNTAHSFVVPVGSRLLVGRTDPANGVFPDVDITMWSQRVNTPDGPLYTVHRKQCFISRDADGALWVVDYKEYVGDTMVSPAGSGQFRTIPALAGERATNSEGGIKLEIGDRILMGQAEGMLIFVITEE